jgi:general stress protein CsbA
MSSLSVASQSVPPTNENGHPFPYLRWLALMWLIVWIPAYWKVWGWQNFLHICDLSLALSCAGVWFGNSLLISSQALAAIPADAAWCLDAGWRLFSGHHLFGGTEYLWDERFPLWVRLLSLFHLFLPFILVWACTRVGYDRRALKLQTMITAALLGASRLLGPVSNMNYMYQDPIFHKALGPAPINVAIIFSVIVILFWPVHLVMRKAIQTKPS